jgi:hypothetical protein
LRETWKLISLGIDGGYVRNGIISLLKNTTPSLRALFKACLVEGLSVTLPELQYSLILEDSQEK